VVNENVSLVVSRIVLTEVANSLTRLNDQVSKEVAHYTLEKVSLTNKILSRESLNYFVAWVEI